MKIDLLLKDDFNGEREKTDSRYFQEG